MLFNSCEYELSIIGNLALTTPIDCMPSTVLPYGWPSISIRCLSGKLWYLQHNCVGDTIVYHWASERIFMWVADACEKIAKKTSLFWLDCVFHQNCVYQYVDSMRDIHNSLLFPTQICAKMCQHKIHNVNYIANSGDLMYIINIVRTWN